MSGKSGSGVIIVARTFSLRANDAQTKSLCYNKTTFIMRQRCTN